MHDYLASVAPEELPTAPMTADKCSNGRRSSSSQASASSEAPERADDTTGQPDLPHRRKVSRNGARHMLHICIGHRLKLAATLLLSLISPEWLSFHCNTWTKLSISSWMTRWHTCLQFSPSQCLDAVTKHVKKLIQIVILASPRSTQTFNTHQVFSFNGSIADTGECAESKSERRRSITQ